MSNYLNKRTPAFYRKLHGPTFECWPKCWVCSRRAGVLDHCHRHQRVQNNCRAFLCASCNKRMPTDLVNVDVSARVNDSTIPARPEYLPIASAKQARIIYALLQCDGCKRTSAGRALRKALDEYIESRRKEMENDNA